MVATTTPTSAPVVWQGRTQDGHALRLTRSGLAKIASNLQQTGLYHLAQNHLNGSREEAIVRSIAKIVSKATQSKSGQKTQVFTAIGKTRTYEIVTQPMGQKQSVIRLVRSRPNREFESEGEFEHEYEGEFEYEGEYEVEYALWSDHLKPGLKKVKDNLSDLNKKLNPVQRRQAQKRREKASDAVNDQARERWKKRGYTDQQLADGMRSLLERHIMSGRQMGQLIRNPASVRSRLIRGQVTEEVLNSRFNLYWKALGQWLQQRGGNLTTLDANIQTGRRGTPLDPGQKAIYNDAFGDTKRYINSGSNRVCKAINNHLLFIKRFS